MSDTKSSMPAVRPEGPAYHETTEMPAVKVPSSALDAVLAEVRAMRAEQNDTRKELKADIQLVANDLGIVKDRVKLTEDRIGHLENRSETQSIRVNATTENDAKHDAAIGSLVADVASLKESHEALTKTQDKQLAILERLDKVAANPMVRRVAYAIGGVILAWAAGKGWLTR